MGYLLRRGQTILKGEPYEALLRLTEAELKDLFPFGASSIIVGSLSRWEPAEKGKADKTLAKLLRDKKSKEEVPLFMAQSGPQRLRWSNKDKKWVPKEFEGVEEHGYTKTRHRALLREDVEVVSPQWHERFSKEAANRYEVLHAEEQRRAEVRTYLAQLRQLAIEQIKAGGDPGPMLSAVVAQFERKGKKAA